MIVGVGHHDLLLGAEAEAVRGVELAVALAEAAKLAPTEAKILNFTLNQVRSLATQMQHKNNSSQASQWADLRSE